MVLSHHLGGNPKSSCLHIHNPLNSLTDLSQPMELAELVPLWKLAGIPRSVVQAYERENSAIRSRTIFTHYDDWEGKWIRCYRNGLCYTKNLHRVHSHRGQWTPRTCRFRPRIGVQERTTLLEQCRCSGALFHCGGNADHEFPLKNSPRTWFNHPSEGLFRCMGVKLSSLTDFRFH